MFFKSRLICKLCTVYIFNYKCCSITVRFANTMTYFLNDKNFNNCISSLVNFYFQKLIISHTPQTIVLQPSGHIKM